MRVSNPTMSRKVFTHADPLQRRILARLSNEMSIKNVARYYGYGYIFNGDPHITVAETTGVETTPVDCINGFFENSAYTIPSTH